MIDTIKFQLTITASLFLLLPCLVSGQEIFLDKIKTEEAGEKRDLV